MKENTYPKKFHSADTNQLLFDMVKMAANLSDEKFAEFLRRLKEKICL